MKEIWRNTTKHFSNNGRTCGNKLEEIEPSRVPSQSAQIEHEGFQDAFLFSANGRALCAQCPDWKEHPGTCKEQCIRHKCGTGIAPWKFMAQNITNMSSSELTSAALDFAAGLQWRTAQLALAAFRKQQPNNQQQSHTSELIAPPFGTNYSKLQRSFV